MEPSHKGEFRASDYGVRPVGIAEVRGKHERVAFFRYLDVRHGGEFGFATFIVVVQIEHHRDIPIGEVGGLVEVRPELLADFVLVDDIAFIVGAIHPRIVLSVFLQTFGDGVEDDLVHSGVRDGHGFRWRAGVGPTGEERIVGVWRILDMIQH